jgi:hypothetical protein
VAARRWLSIVAGISLVYDVTVGCLLLVATNAVARWFSAPLPSEILFVKLDAIFLICVGLGYVLPLRHPETYRGYLWIFGPLLKGAGAIAFLADHYVNGSPSTFLLFAASDGTLALATLGGLLRPR